MKKEKKVRKNVLLTRYKIYNIDIQYTSARIYT